MYRNFQKHYIIFFLLIITICIMSLLDRDALIGIYLFFAHLLSIDPVWVTGTNAIVISNGGHVITCFLLTWTAFRVFQNSYLKAVFFVAGLATLVEFLQFFSATRQAKFEDILFSLSGVLLASFLIAFHNRCFPAPETDR